MEIKKKMDFSVALFLLLAMGGLYQSVDEFSSYPFSTNSPQFFPLLMILMITLLSVWLLFTSLSFGKSSGEKIATNTFRLSSGTALQLFTIIILGAYIALIPVFSYIPCTIVFLFISMAVLGGNRDFKTLALYFGISCLTTGFLYFVFARLLHFILP